MTPGGIFEAFRERQIEEIHRSDLEISDDNIGLKGSPTRVFQSFTKAVKGKGTVVSLDAQESAEWLASRLQEKFII